MKWQDHITIDPAVVLGKPVVKGTRMTVEYVIDLLARGWSAEQVLQEHPQLTAEDVQACLAYASEILKGEKVYVTPA